MPRLAAPIALAHGLPLDVEGPALFPGYGHFDLRSHAGLRRTPQRDLAEALR